MKDSMRASQRQRETPAVFNKNIQNGGVGGLEDKDGRYQDSSCSLGSQCKNLRTLAGKSFRGREKGQGLSGGVETKPRKGNRYVLLKKATSWRTQTEVGGKATEPLL